MSEDRFQIEKGLYVLDSSGSAPEGKTITRQVDALFKEVEATFKPGSVRSASHTPETPMNHQQSVAARFKSDTANHVMTIKHDSGVYRHIVYAEPETRCHMFELVTWPGHLSISGDMGTYVFLRLHDMFTFFNQANINPQYWMEKCEAVYRHTPLMEYKQTLADEYLKELRESDDEDERELYENLKDANTEDEDSFREDLREHMDDSWELRFDEFTHRFLWCLNAIRWGVEVYHSKGPK